MLDLLKKLHGSDGERSRAGARRYRAPRVGPALEGLEARDLKTGAITLSWDQINITAPQASGNQAYVWNDGNTVDIWVDGEFAQFDRSQVNSVAYTSGGGGSDTFYNYTN